MTDEHFAKSLEIQIGSDDGIEIEYTTNLLELYEDYYKVGQELNHQHDKINKILMTKQKLKHFISLLKSFQTIENDVIYKSKYNSNENNYKNKKGNNNFLNNNDKKYQRLLSEYEILKSEKNQIEKNLVELQKEKNKNYRITKTINNPKPKSKPLRVGTLDDDLMRAGLGRRFTTVESNERSTS